MILNLSIKNFLIFESYYIDFKTGLSVLHHHDKADKSLITKALIFCFGLESFDNCIREGADSCSITSEVDIKNNLLVRSILQEYCIDHSDTLIFRRYLQLNNRQEFFINDQQVTSTVIEQISSKIFVNHTTDLGLFDKNLHLNILDEYAEVDQHKKQLKQAYERWQNSSIKLEQILQLEQELPQEISYLEDVIESLSAVRPNEESILTEQIKQIQLNINQQKAIKESILLLEKINLQQTTLELAKKLRNNTSLQEVIFLLEQSLANLDECKMILQNKTYEESLEYQIFEIEERLFEIRTLARRYQVEAQKLYDFFQDSLSKLSELKNYTKQTEQLKRENQTLLESYSSQAYFLSHQRQNIANTFAYKVNELINKLIPKNDISFVINLEEAPLTQASIEGMDRVNFLFNTQNSLISIEELSLNKLPEVICAIKLALIENIKNSSVLFEQINLSQHAINIVVSQLKTLSLTKQIIYLTDNKKLTL